MEDFDKNLKERFGTDGVKKEFSVPENYFETFSERLSERMQEEKLDKEETPVITLWERCKPLVSFAAMFCGLALTIFVPMSRMDLQNKEVALNDTPLFEDFIDQYYSDDQSFVEDLFAEGTSDDVYDEVSDESIESYFVAELSSYELSMYDLE